MTTLYETDLAYIHNVGFNFFADGATEFLLDLLGSSGIDDGLVVDIGCGGGLWAGHLKQAGYDVHGIDISADMIRLARKHVPEGEFVVGSLYSTKLPTCRAITAVGEVINYITPGTTNKSRAAFFRRAYRALTPGGLLVVDFAQLGRLGKKGDHERVFEGPDWFLGAKFSEDKKKRVLTRDLTIFRRDKNKAKYHRDHEVHRLHLLDAKEVAATLRSIGFRVRRRNNYGKLAFRPGYAALIARKPMHPR